MHSLVHYYLSFEDRKQCGKQWNDWTLDWLCCGLLLFTLDCYLNLHPSLCFWQCRYALLPLSSHLSYILGFVSCFFEEGIIKAISVSFFNQWVWNSRFNKSYIKDASENYHLFSFRTCLLIVIFYFLLFLKTCKIIMCSMR